MTEEVTSNEITLDLLIQFMEMRCVGVTQSADAARWELIRRYKAQSARETTVEGRLRDLLIQARQYVVGPHYMEYGQEIDADIEEATSGKLLKEIDAALGPVGSAQKAPAKLRCTCNMGAAVKGHAAHCALSTDDPAKVKCIICGKLSGEHTLQELADCSVTENGRPPHVD